MASDARTVLMVDDEPRLLDAVRLYLELDGYRVLTATTGERALESTREQLPDVVLLDVMLPGIDGF